MPGERYTRVTLIHNPSAGGGGGSLAPDELLGALREAGYAPTYFSSKDDYGRWIGDPGKLVVVAGGDGTIGRVAKQLAGRGIPLAVVATGTANNIATALGIGGTLRSQVDAWGAARRQPVDIGIASGPWGEWRFLESVGGGLFAEAMPMLDRTKEVIAGSMEPEEMVARARQALADRLRHISPRLWRVRLDGEDHSGEYLLVELMNIRCAGPNLVLAPNADAADGLLDAVFLTVAGRAECEDALRSVGAAGAEAVKGVAVRRATRVELEVEGCPLHIDDEAWPKACDAARRVGPVHLTLQRHAIELLIPQSSPDRDAD